MSYRSLRECVDDLERTGRLVRIDAEVDPCLEAAEIQRRVFAAGGPAVYFANLSGCRFPAVSNVFGTLERARYMFRGAIERVQLLAGLKTDPERLRSTSWGKLFGAAPALLHMSPRQVRSGPVLAQQTRLTELPQITCWPDDGGAFITLPQVYSEHPDRPGWRSSNLGMYRVQLSGNDYAPDSEVGLHYQIHRGIGVHHQAALAAGRSLPVNVFVGGPPAMTLAAVMPLPEGLSELSFAGALGARRVRLAVGAAPLPIAADADFCLVGEVVPGDLKPEGPFGDHLGYYAKQHDYPVLQVRRVYHRDGAIWPFTVVGRPPQEDTIFGELIHEIVRDAAPAVLPGVRGVHAVDAAGVHPLLLAIGSERYQPFAERTGPQELLTQASAILGNGQLSLAKYLWIANGADDPSLDLHDVASFLRHMLARCDWSRDLHFTTETTIDTLDYSGDSVNRGSKLVVAAAGPPIRELPYEIASDLVLPERFTDARLALPGVLVVQAPGAGARTDEVDADLRRFCETFPASAPINRWPLVVLVDDSEFASRSLRNFLWTTFTRSNPATDVHGVSAFTRHKHWGCRGSLVIDARLKPHHAPPLVEDPAVTRRVDALFARGGPLAEIE